MYQKPKPKICFFFRQSDSAGTRKKFKKWTLTVNNTRLVFQIDNQKQILISQIHRWRCCTDSVKFKSFAVVGGRAVLEGRGCRRLRVVPDLGVCFSYLLFFRSF
jgi:hypothetical protein